MPKQFSTPILIRQGLIQNLETGIICKASLLLLIQNPEQLRIFSLWYNSGGPVLELHVRQNKGQLSAIDKHCKR
ncbi:MAG: hypothetical protein ACOYLR_11325 [Chlorobium sp.]